jgi:hypothetical protein
VGRGREGAGGSSTVCCVCVGGGGERVVEGQAEGYMTWHQRKVASKMAYRTCGLMPYKRGEEDYVLAYS